MQMQRPEMTVGEALRRARLQADLTLCQAAPLLGVDETTLSRYERNKLEAPVHVIGLSMRAYRSLLPGIVYLEHVIRVLRTMASAA